MDSPPEHMVETEGLSRCFNGLRAVDDLTVRIGQGEIFGLVGPDGAGKTTTFRLLSGLLKPCAGKARVAGCDVATQRDRLRDHIGYMPQRFGLYLDLTVEENLRFCADLFGVAGNEWEQRMRRLLGMTRMERFRGRQAGKLSGGMKQKLALMGSLLHRPEVLLLDEPTNGVDPVSRRDFWTILYELLQDGITILVSTAYLDEAERCNRVGLMYQGRLIACDQPERLGSQLEQTCFEVETSNPPQTRRLLQDEPEVLSAEPSGGKLHVFLNPDGTPGALEERVKSAGLGPARFREVQPTLEDVFIALVRSADLSQP